MVILINARACAGKAMRKWRAIKGEVAARLGGYKIYFARDLGLAGKYIAWDLSKGERQFIAAGGDGTFNFLLNSIIETADEQTLSEVTLGAIGLGSSNDFHKPFDRTTMIKGTPCRIDFGSSSERDVGVLRYVDSSGTEVVRHWIINASLGVTAEANSFFNDPDRFLSFCKRYSTGMAIAYAALKTMARFRAMPMTLSADCREPAQLQIENLGIVKSPHFSGHFHYDSPIDYASGRFHVHLIDQRSAASKLLTLSRLAHGKMSRRDSEMSLEAHRIYVKSEKPFAVEFDGEVVTTKSASFTLRPRMIRVCSC
jgi:diacylglycerol kinase family enzyme